MPGIVPALEAGDDVVLRSHHIYYLAFAFISELRACYNCEHLNRVYSDVKYDKFT